MDSANLRKVIVFGDEFWKFYNKQNTKIKERINWTIKLVQTVDRIPKKYFKHIVDTTLYEYGSFPEVIFTGYSAFLTKEI